MSSAFNIPAGWKIDRQPTGELVINGPQAKAGVVVREAATELRMIPEEVLFMLASDLLAAAPPVDAVPGEPRSECAQNELAEAVAWLKSDEVNAGPRTLKSISVVLAALAASVAVPVEPAASAAERDLLAERRRQAEAEGYSADHDAAHGTSELALAAAAYALSSVHGLTAKALSPWPWETRSFKPKHPYRDLERAGALVLAAMECWQRRLSKNLASDQEFVESRRLAASVASRAGSEPVASTDVEAAIDAFIEDYEMLGEAEDGRDASYSPNENDRALLKDGFMGLLADDRVVMLLRRCFWPAIAPAAAAEPSDPLQELTDLSQEMGLYEVPEMNADRAAAEPSEDESRRANQSEEGTQSELWRIGLLEWGVAGWRSEVQNRPAINIHRQRLDNFWRRVIRKAGGDPDVLVGPEEPAPTVPDRERAASLVASEDTKRLDWIESKVCDVSRLGDAARTLRISWNNGADSMFVGPDYSATWREAIDRAIAGEAQS